MKNIISLIIAIFIANNSYGCTAFGIVTDSGTIIGKNRDYYYDSQEFKLVFPNKQFSNWYNNNYHHENKFFALLSKQDVKMGINQYGLTAIEEDPIFPSTNDRKYIQPINGNAEGMVLYGILQNFSAVDEIIPYIKDIFSVAAPNFYQIADKKKILYVEVGFTKNNNDNLRPYVYRIIDIKNDYFVHTNVYLSKDFAALNKLTENIDGENGSYYRLNTIKNLLLDSKNNDATKFFMSTKSDLSKSNNKYWCQNTSIFRSYINEVKYIKIGKFENDKVYGTVSSLVVSNNNKATKINLKILDSLNTLSNKDQKIIYNELQITLDDLFKSKTLKFVKKSFIRKAPYNNRCK